MTTVDELNLRTMGGLLDVVFDSVPERGDSQLSDTAVNRSAGVVGARLDDGPPQLAITEASDASEQRQRLMLPVGE